MEELMHNDFLEIALIGAGKIEYDDRIAVVAVDFYVAGFAESRVVHYFKADSPEWCDAELPTPFVKQTVQLFSGHVLASRRGADVTHRRE